MNATEQKNAIDLVRLGDPTDETTWLISDWNAGQSSIVEWNDQNVRIAEDGLVELVLDAAPEGSSRPYHGGEIQSSASASTGTWRWLAQAPEMQEGAVFGMFLYQADWQNDPWLEFDFEFVGSDTTQVELNIHMEDGEGRHIVLEDGPMIIELGFDAADALHLYEIELTGTEAIFSVDGQVVATFDAFDMPGDTWYSGEVRGFADLWAVAPAQESWAGEWNYGGEPLVARLADLGTPSDPLDITPWQPDAETSDAPAPDANEGTPKPEDQPATDPKVNFSRTENEPGHSGGQGEDSVEGSDADTAQEKDTAKASEETADHVEHMGMDGSLDDAELTDETLHFQIIGFAFTEEPFQSAFASSEWVHHSTLPTCHIPHDCTAVF
ncbi:MAG: family 16 glycosylhydrolase [Parvularcula sp.]|jgi:beta-glucanase (GH16 family)|nr:family 16 glycosylhydrolase [Parvularcula sp.]